MWDGRVCRWEPWVLFTDRSRRPKKGGDGRPSTPSTSRYGVGGLAVPHTAPSKGPKSCRWATKTPCLVTSRRSGPPPCPALLQMFQTWSSAHLAPDGPRMQLTQHRTLRSQLSSTARKHRSAGSGRRGAEPIRAKARQDPEGFLPLCDGNHGAGARQKWVRGAAGAAPGGCRAR